MLPCSSMQLTGLAALNDDGDSLGQEYSDTYRCILGGDWPGGRYTGSRCVEFMNKPMNALVNEGAR